MDIKCGLMDQNTPRHFFSYEKKCWNLGLSQFNHNVQV